EALDPDSTSASPESTPIRRIPSACCARAESGHTRAPPRKPHTLRRLRSCMESPLRAVSTANVAKPHRQSTSVESLSQTAGWVFGADLNRSESRCDFAPRPRGRPGPSHPTTGMEKIRVLRLLGDFNGMDFKFYRRKNRLRNELNQKGLSSARGRGPPPPIRPT